MIQTISRPILSGGAKTARLGCMFRTAIMPHASLCSQNGRHEQMIRLPQQHLHQEEKQRQPQRRWQSIATCGGNDTEQCAHTLLILGKPGGGKGTISGKILQDFPVFRHVSTGDELRQHVREETPLGIEAKKYMNDGLLVPDGLIIQMVMDDAVEAMKKCQSLLLDGFPRTMEQAVALDEKIDVDMVVNLNIPNETIIERISDRWIHPGSGRVYNYSYKPPKVVGKDDQTGEPLVQREDDKPESVQKRLESYEKATAPLVDYYDKKGVLQTFSGTMSDVIYPEVKVWLDEQLVEDFEATS